MDIKKWRIWQNSLFKQLGFLFGSVERVQQHIMIASTGSIDLKALVVGVGVLLDPVNKMAWVMQDDLRLPLGGKDSSVLSLSELSCYPLDPFGRFNKDEQEIKSIEELHKAHYGSYWSKMRADAKARQSNSALKLILWGCFVITALIVFGLMMRGCK